MGQEPAEQKSLPSALMLKAPLRQPSEPGPLLLYWSDYEHSLRRSPSLILEPDSGIMNPLHVPVTYCRIYSIYKVTLLSVKVGSNTPSWFTIGPGNLCLGVLLLKTSYSPQYLKVSFRIYKNDINSATRSLRLVNIVETLGHECTERNLLTGRLVARSRLLTRTVVA